MCSQLHGEPAYDVTALTKRLPGGTRPAVDGVTFTVGRGEVFGIAGRNGAGKSTVLRHLAGLFRPDAGTVRLFGREVTTPRAVAAAGAAYLAQDQPALDDLPVRRAVELTARLRGRSRRDAVAGADAVLAELGLTGLARRRVGRLSGGQARLAGLATALVVAVPVLLLDEPTAGLDPPTRAAAWAALRRRRDEDGTTVVVITHDLAEAETHLDRVLVLNAGRSAGCDTPRRLTRRLHGSVRLDVRWRDEPRGCSYRLAGDQVLGTLGDLLAPGVLDRLDGLTLTPPSLADLLAEETEPAR